MRRLPLDFEDKILTPSQIVWKGEKYNKTNYEIIGRALEDMMLSDVTLLYDDDDKFVISVKGRTFIAKSLIETVLKAIRFYYAPPAPTL